MKTEPTTKRTNGVADLLDHWKVWIWIRGSGVIHVLSRTEPVIKYRFYKAYDEMIGMEMDVITGTEHGDTIGFIDWSEVGAVSWRFCPERLA